MRRSAQVAAPLLAAALAFSTGCHKAEMQRCVDEQNMVVDDDLCHAIGEQRVYNSRVKPPNYRYYYGGAGSAESGTTATGGSFEPDTGHTYKITDNSPVAHRGVVSSTYAPWIIGAAGLLILWNAGSKARPK
jgi:hypothetical protein